MKYALTLIGIFLMTSFSLAAEANAQALPDARAAAWVTLDGAPCDGGNPIGADGRIREFKSPALCLKRTSAKKPHGTMLIFPGGGYGILAVEKEGFKTAAFLNAQGYDAVVLEYPVSPSNQAAMRDKALAVARAAWELLRRDAGKLGLSSGRLGVMGFSAGGHLAARLAQSLPDDAQPADLVLIYPAYLNETAPASTIPAVQPSTAAKRLFMVIAKNDHSAWVAAAEIYSKSFIDNGGEAKWRILPDGGHGFGMGTTGMSTAAKTWPDELAAFLAAEPAPARANRAVEPANP